MQKATLMSELQQLKRKLQVMEEEIVRARGLIYDIQEQLLDQHENGVHELWQKILFHHSYTLEEA